MTTQLLFQTHLVLGYVAWLLCFGAYIWPWLRSMEPLAAQRVIATLHSFRFFGLVFLLPGVVSPNLPASFAVFAAYGDFATGVLAMLALLTVRIRPLFWLFVVAFNLAGTVDLIVDYYDAIQVGLPAHAEWLGALDSGDNPFAGPRSRPFPLPPLRGTAKEELFGPAARRLSWGSPPEQHPRHRGGALHLSGLRWLRPWLVPEGHRQLCVRQRLLRVRPSTDRCFPRRSELAFASVSSPYCASQGRRESDSGDALRASYAHRPLVADHRCRGRASRGNGVVAHSQMRIVCRSLL